MALLYPLSKPEITPEDRKAVLGVLDTSMLALGPKLREFEETISKFVGRKYGVAVNSGTSALHLMVRALGIGKGDEVITTPFSFIASANCILFEGATPVFVDVDHGTRNINPGLIEKAITKRTKAILAVDVFGQTCYWDAILKIARKHKLFVIEDSCEALASTYKRKRCGSLGDISVFSFYPNKQMTTGEGGLVVTDNPKLYELIMSMRNQGRDESGAAQRQKKGIHRSWLQHVRLGYNYRISEMNCALGLSQFSRITRVMKTRERITKLYNEYLGAVPGVITPYRASYATDINWMHYVVELEGYTAKKRDALIERLKKEGIQTSNYFPSIHLQEFYRKEFGFKKGDFPVSEHISERALALPLTNNLSRRDVARITAALANLL